MKNITSILFCLFMSFAFAYSQNSDLAAPAEPPPLEPPIFETPEVLPEFPGGQSALYKWLSTNIIYPQMAKEQGISGKVYVQFTIDEEGNVKDAKIMRSVSKELDDEALRVIQKMPKWSPAILKGNPIKSIFKLPINFVLQ